jgi:hypothetical protein
MRMGSVSMHPYAVLSFAGASERYTTRTAAKDPPSVCYITMKCPPEAIYERRYFERLETTRITPCLDDALPEERRPMLVVVEVVYALKYGKLGSMLRKEGAEGARMQFYRL